MINKRVVAKAFSWKVVTWSLLFMLTGEIILIGIYAFITFFLYYVHEILWNKTDWGKNE